MDGSGIFNIRAANSDHTQDVAKAIARRDIFIVTGDEVHTLEKEQVNPLFTKSGEWITRQELHANYPPPNS